MENLFENACSYAIKMHKGQKRKDGTNYILHPFEVTTIASTMTNDEEILASAILHDVPEECNIEIDEIIQLFGKRVGIIVALETEPKYLHLSKTDSWKLRKQESINRLKSTDDIGYKIVFLSDKLANIRSIYNEYLKGINSFENFNIKDKNTQAWYYYNVLENIKELKEFSAYKEYEEKINIIFSDIRKGKSYGEKNHTL